MTMNIAVMLKLRTIAVNHYALLCFSHKSQHSDHTGTNTKNNNLCMILHDIICSFPRYLQISTHPIARALR